MARFALAVFVAAQVVLGTWAWILRLITLSEVHDFSLWRAFWAMILAWLAVLIVGGGIVATLVHFTN